MQKDTYKELMELMEKASPEELKKLIEFARALVALRNQ